MRRKVTILVTAFVAMAGLVALVCFTSPPAAPLGWAQVHPGMSRAQVLTLAGPPPRSGWPENTTETWQRKRFFSERRLFVVYQGEVVESVCDGTWLPGYGWHQPRIETQ